MTARKVAIGMRILGGRAVVALAVMALIAAALPPPVNFVFSQNPEVGTEPYSSAVGDFNRDGIPDIAVTNYASDSVSLLFGRGDGTFQPAVPIPAGVEPTGIVASDLNRSEERRAGKQRR